MIENLARGKRKKHPLYRKWVDMKTRCYNKNYKNHNRYGARGIAIQESWMEYDNFYKDMIAKFERAVASGTKKPTLDRKDNDAGYTKNNCRFITQAEQNLNYSRNRILEKDGRKQTLKEWSDELGIPSDRIYARINRLGWTAQKALTN
jgi:hypothetical protein